MANGDYLTRHELRELSKPIMDIKPDIDNFAKSHSLYVVYNVRDWAHVELRWKNLNELNCNINFSLKDNKYEFEMEIGAYIYAEDKYYYKIQTMVDKIKPPFNSNSIISEMENGMAICNTWSVKDLTLLDKEKL